MKALISPIESREAGFRVAEVHETSFDVASPFFWIDCPDDTVADAVWFDPADQQLKPFPEPELQPQPTVDGAETL